MKTAHVLTADKRYPASGEYKISSSPSAAVVLAAGEGSRLRKDFPSTPKALIKLEGKPLIYYPVKEFYDFGIRKFVIVVSPDAQKCVGVLKTLFPNALFFRSFQKKPLGTAHALGKAEKITGGIIPPRQECQWKRVL